ncbi:hypothetical protein AVEN_217363-1 [Araneus ventricosus]|uniref:Uncharacterized protein n=1 Tax=Araneus ventricosus TaxID=182803 RepID=A0A4Y2S3D5_ARAVE|nr:hypothetical protein AVEN_217363-1 [Araneus ventricosus]
MFFLFVLFNSYGEESLPEGRSPVLPTFIILRIMWNASIKDKDQGLTKERTFLITSRAMTQGDNVCLNKRGWFAVALPDSRTTFSFQLIARDGFFLPRSFYAMSPPFLKTAELCVNKSRQANFSPQLSSRIINESRPSQMAIL